MQRRRRGAGSKRSWATSPLTHQMLHCSVCGGEHTFRSCPRRDEERKRVIPPASLTSSSKPRFEDLAGGGSLPIPRGPTGPCLCWRGLILLDATTNAEVGEEIFFFDSDEEAYFLRGKKLDTMDLDRVDWSTPKFRVPSRYLSSDGKIHGTVAAYECCDLCERSVRMKLRGRIRWPMLSLSGRRRYVFEFGPDAPSGASNAFYQFQSRFEPRTRREYQELLIGCFLFFGRYSTLRRHSERALARRFKLSRGRVRSIRLRYRELLRRPAVRP